MKKGILLQAVFVLVAIALGWLPQPALAQHGGHGRGGGFHGGGGGGFHGGGSGAFHGGEGGGFHGRVGFYAGGHSGYGGHYYSGYRGGYYGGRGYYRGRGSYGWGYGRGGRYWGRGYGYGWGWGWGFGFGWPYWGWGYPYGYYYNPWYYAPNPYYSYSHYPDPNNGDDDPPPADPNVPPEPNQKAPIKSWGLPSPGEDTADPNYANSNVAALAPRRPVISVDRIGVTPSSYRATRSIPDRSTTEWAAPQPDAALRPEMQRALQRLREMPPFAREREIETGRYRQLSSEEKQILRTAALPSRATIRDLPDSFPQRVSLNSSER